MYFFIFIWSLAIYKVCSLTGTLNPTQQKYSAQYAMADWSNSFYFTIESKYVPYSYLFNNISYPGTSSYHIFSLQNSQINANASSYIFLSYLKIDTTKQTLTHIFEIQTTLRKYTETYTLNNLNYEGQWYSLEIRNNAVQQLLNITFYQSSNKTNLFNKIYINEYFPIENYFSFYLGDCLISQNLQINQFQGSIKFQLLSASTKFTPQTISCSSNSGYALKSISNFTEQTFYEFQTKDKIARSYGISSWIKINQSNFLTSNYTNVIHIQNNPNVNYLNEIGGRLTNVIYAINSTKQIVQLIYQSYTFPIQQNFVNGNEPLEKYLTFEVSNLYSLLNWHYIGLAYRNNQISLLISFPQINYQITKTITNVYQFSDLNLVIHLGGTNYNYSNNNGTFGNPYFFTCLSTFVPICHYTCSTCFGPFLNQCLTCSSSSKRYLSNTSKCICKSGYLDINYTTCSSFSSSDMENLIPLSSMEGYDQQYPEVVCSYGYFKYDDQCFQCPKLNIRYFCPECIQYPNTWVFNPVCTQNYNQFNQSQNNTFTQDIILSSSSLIEVLNPQDIYTFNNLELQFCSYCNSLCLTSPFSSSCKNSSYYHLEQNIMVVCSNTKLMIDKQCRFCPTNCSQCAYINYQYICIKWNDPVVLNPGCRSNTDICDDCVDHIKYYLSLNQAKCFLCQIPNCKYCFEFHSQNIYQNSLFNTQTLNYEQSDIIVGCALCYSGYIYNFKTGRCEQNLKALGNECVHYYITEQNNPLCLISSLSNFSQAKSIQNCYTYLAHCYQCFYPTTNQYYCLKCDKGYYIARLQGTCQSCNEYNNLYSECYQESYTPQNYKYELIPQLFNLTQQYLVNAFLTQQSLSMTVTNCISQYQTITSSNCQQLDNQYCQYYDSACRTCDSTLEGTQRLTILNLKCSNCPYYCEYCKPRLESEIYAINPFTNFTAYNTNYYLTYRCIMKSTIQQYLFFDNEQQLVRLCSQDIPKCQLEIQQVDLLSELELHELQQYFNVPIFIYQQSLFSFLLQFKECYWFCIKCK